MTKYYIKKIERPYGKWMAGLVVGDIRKEHKIYQEFGKTRKEAIKKLEELLFLHGFNIVVAY